MSSWRKWATPITLLLLLAFLGYGLWWGWQQLTRPPELAAPPTCITQSASVLTASQVSVQVFNGGSTSGRAGQISEQLKAKGFNTKSPTNTSEAVEGTIIIGSAADDPGVLLVQGFFPESTIRPDARTDGSVDILVGDAFAGFNDKAAVEIGVPGGTICVQTTPPPTAEPEPEPTA
ncbi:MAG: LytR C-terminal domain-containing protein [Brooklawnia sp.]|jgi:hypothetical protein